METRPYIGGQAVLEGVMMRSPGSFAVVVRRRDGSLSVRERVMNASRTGLAKLPFFRGVASLVESLRLGSEALRYSADLMQTDFDNDTPKKTPSGISGTLLRAIGYQLFLFASADGDPSRTVSKEKSRGIGPMLILMVGFLIALPQVTASGIMKLVHVDWPVTSMHFQALTGAVKLTIVLGYLMLIRRLPDIKRVFQYHGAEHKTISTYEANEALEVANARAKSTLHARCGTTFLVMIVFISIVLFSIVGVLLPIHTGSRVWDNVLFFLVKLPVLPVLAAVTFEIQRLFARYCTTGPLRALLLPGFLVQRITTIEPDDAQLEVALASLRATLFREEGLAKEKTNDVAFPTYAAMVAAESLHAPAPPAPMGLQRS